MLVRVVEQYHGVVVGYYRFLILYAVGVHELEWRFWPGRRGGGCWHQKQSDKA